VAKKAGWVSVNVKGDIWYEDDACTWIFEEEFFNCGKICTHKITNFPKSLAPWRHAQWSTKDCDNSRLACVKMLT